MSDDLETSSAAVLTTRESVSMHEEGFHIYRMRVAEVIKGNPNLVDDLIEVASIEELPAADCFLHIGYGEAPTEWIHPNPMSSEAATYVRELRDLPNQGPVRLKYFLRHLRHANDLVATDAYNEFADATLKDIAALSAQIDRLWVISQLRDATVPVHRRRLCWTLLSQCGSEQDAALFDELLQQRRDNVTFDPGMDAAIGCFLTLGGECALARIERDYLENSEASYVDTFAAIGAIRVHGTELELFTRERLAASLRKVLGQPAIADLVISDLARWEDWSVVDRVSELFIDASEETCFVKPAAVMYLTTCPLPAADKSLERLRKHDPETVQAAEASMRFYSQVTTVPVPPPDVEASEDTSEKKSRR
ncbi:MAG: hypothetical protein AAF670_05530 [Planctomycetota bacterium]